jgi:tetratricopeptide (TPR) repeat protein
LIFISFWLEISEQKARLAAFVTEQEKFTKAESNEDIRLELRALESKEQTFGLHHPGLISTLWTLSSLYRQEKRLQEALAASERALFISETIYGKNHIETAITMSNVGAVLLEMKRYQECHDHLLNGHQIVVQ